MEREAKKGTYYRFEKSFEHEEIISEVISQQHGELLQEAGGHLPTAASPRSKMPLQTG
jgi:hypothetical protein